MSLRPAIRRQLRSLASADGKSAVLASLAASERIGAATLAAVADRLPDATHRDVLRRHSEDLRRHADELPQTATRDGSPFDWLAGCDGYGRDLRGVPAPEALVALGPAGALATWSESAALGVAVFEHCHSKSPTPWLATLREDARRHVAELEPILAALGEAGHGDAIARARKALARSAAFANWKRLGIRSGAGFSRFVLYVAYWTVLLPFGLLTRRPKPSPKQPPKDGAAPLARLRTQY